MKTLFLLFFGAAVLAAPASAQHVHWAQAIPLPANSEVTAMATDHSGNLYAAFVIGQQQPDRYGSLYAVGDVQLMKFDSLGNTIWSHDITGQGRVFDLTVDAGNHLVLCGIFLSGLEFDSHTIANLPVQFPRFGSFLARLDINGEVVWLNHAVLPDYDLSMVSVATDSQSNIYVTGIDHDIHGLFTKYSASGDSIWTRNFPGVRTFADVTVNEQDEVLITGTCNPSIDFDSIVPAFDPGIGYFQFLLHTNGQGQALHAWVKPFITFDFSSAVATSGGHTLWHYPASPSQNALGNYLSGLSPAGSETSLYQDAELSAGFYPQTLARSSSGHLVFMHTEMPFTMAQAELSLHQFQNGVFSSMPEFQVTGQGLEGTALTLSGEATYLGGHFFAQTLQVGGVTLQNPYSPAALERQVFIARIGQSPLSAEAPNQVLPLGIFPNPAANQFTVAAPANAVAERLEIFDQTGRLVQAQQWPTETEKLVVSTGLPAGMYVVRLQTNQGVATRKLVLAAP